MLADDAIPNFDFLASDDGVNGVDRPGSSFSSGRIPELGNSAVSPLALLIGMSSITRALYLSIR